MSATSHCARCGGEFGEGELKKLAQPPSDSGYTLEHHDAKGCVDHMKRELERIEQSFESRCNQLASELEEIRCKGETST
jgi:hypothetical protein